MGSAGGPRKARRRCCRPASPGGEPATDAADLATYSLTPAFSADGAFRLPVEAGALPGDYTLEFILLDSDGGILPTADRLAVPPVTLSVVARHAVTYTVNETSVGLFVSIQNVGPEAISSDGDASAELEVLYQPIGRASRGPQRRRHPVRGRS